MSDEQTLAPLLESLAFVAIEYEEALDLARFTHLLDLYAHHLAADGAGVPFEAFVTDAIRLRAAASAAARATGVPTFAPAPLGGASAEFERAGPAPNDERGTDAGRPRAA